MTNQGRSDNLSQSSQYVSQMTFGNTKKVKLTHWLVNLDIESGLSFMSLLDLGLDMSVIQIHHLCLHFHQIRICLIHLQVSIAGSYWVIKQWAVAEPTCHWIFKYGMWRFDIAFEPRCLSEGDPKYFSYGLSGLPHHHTFYFSMIFLTDFSEVMIERFAGTLVSRCGPMYVLAL